MKGFTLVEMIVSIAIIVIISGIMLANFLFGEDVTDLNNSTQELSVNIRRTEHLALSAAQFNSSVPQGGYGVYFDKNNSPTSYIIFGDTDEDHQYDPPDEKIEEGEIQLKSGIKIKSLDSLSTTSIVFIPPDPTIYINGVTSTESIEITLCIEADCDNYTKKITVTNTGKVEIE